MWVPKACEWIVADENTLRSLQLSTPISFGPRSSILYAGLGLLRRPSLQVLFVALVGSAELMWSLWVTRESRRRFNRTGWLRNETHRPICVFVGMGARSESHLLFKYQRNAPGQVVQLDQRDPQSMAFLWVPVKRYFAAFYAAMQSVRRFDQAVPRAMSTYRTCWLTFACGRVAHYAFARAIWEAARSQCRVLEVNFMAADTTAFAAIDEGSPARFQQHGLLTRSAFVLPAFRHVRAISSFEARFSTRDTRRRGRSSSGAAAGSARTQLPIRSQRVADG